MKFKIKKLSIKVTYIIIGLIIGIVITGCSFNVNATQHVNLTTSDFSFYSANCDFNTNNSYLNSTNTSVYILIDNETNNEYIVLMRSGEVTITPRYDGDYLCSNDKDWRT